MDIKPVVNHHANLEVTYYIVNYTTQNMQKKKNCLPTLYTINFLRSNFILFVRYFIILKAEMIIVQES